MTHDDLSLLRPQDVVAVYRLIEELCDRGGDPQAWREQLLVRLQEMFAAPLAVTYLFRFALDAGALGPKTLLYLERGSHPHWQAYIARGDVRSDPVTPFIMERYGTDFTCTRREWVDDDTWYASEYYRTVREPADMDHSIYSHVGIIRPGVVDGIGICRAVGAPDFTPVDVARLRLIHEELARLWRKHDPLDAHTIPPRQREVLEGIRRGESRKAIATRMDVSEHTVHGYEKSLFDRAGVASRNELQAALGKLVRPQLMP